MADQSRDAFHHHPHHGLESWLMKPRIRIRTFPWKLFWISHYPPWTLLLLSFLARLASPFRSLTESSRIEEKMLRIWEGYSCNLGTSAFQGSKEVEEEGEGQPNRLEVQ